MCAENSYEKSSSSGIQFNDIKGAINSLAFWVKTFERDFKEEAARQKMRELLYSLDNALTKIDEIERLL